MMQSSLGYRQGRTGLVLVSRIQKSRKGDVRRLSSAVLVGCAGLLIAESGIAQSTLPPDEMKQIERATFAYFSCVRSKVTPAHRRYSTPYAAAQAVFESCRREEARLRALGVSDAIQNKLKAMMTKTHFVDIWRK